MTAMSDHYVTAVAATPAEYRMRRGSGSRVDGIQHTAVGCWPIDDQPSHQKEEL